MGMVRVEDDLHSILKTLARNEGRPIGRVLQDAIDQYQRAKFWADMRTGYARLQQDTTGWQEYLDERDEWDQLAGDGLANAPSDDWREADGGL